MSTETDRLVRQIAQQVSDIADRQNQMLDLLGRILVKEIKELMDLSAITAAVQQANSVAESAVTLIQGLAAQIASLKGDPAALQALADSLNSESANLAAAIQANTPAA